ncbi:hypothetical protein RB597_005768 [Gaeumannomyces tritici]
MMIGPCLVNGTAALPTSTPPYPLTNATANGGPTGPAATAAPTISPLYPISNSTSAAWPTASSPSPLFPLSNTTVTAGSTGTAASITNVSTTTLAPDETEMSGVLPVSGPPSSSPYSVSSSTALAGSTSRTATSSTPFPLSNMTLTAIPTGGTFGTAVTSTSCDTTSGLVTGGSFPNQTAAPTGSWINFTTTCNTTTFVTSAPPTATLLPSASLEANMSSALSVLNNSSATLATTRSITFPASTSATLAASTPPPNGSEVRTNATSSTSVYNSTSSTVVFETSLTDAIGFPPSSTTTGYGPSAATSTIVSSAPSEEASATSALPESSASAAPIMSEWPDMPGWEPTISSWTSSGWLTTFLTEVTPAAAVPSMGMGGGRLGPDPGPHILDHQHEGFRPIGPGSSAGLKPGTGETHQGLQGRLWSGLGSRLAAFNAGEGDGSEELEN